MKQQNSDPLPYVQVDRAVKPKAALLAGFLGCTNQHALGSLVEWWELSGDVRELERIVASTPEGVEPKVAITAEVAALRFKLASGHQIDPLALESLGLLEKLPDANLYRVRGMSRFFKPVIDRITARAKASVGGKASAEARKKAFGTAQPRSAPRSGLSSAPVREVFELLPNPARSTAEAGAELHRSLADSGQRSATASKDVRTYGDEPAAQVAVAVTPPTTPEEVWTDVDFWRWAQDLRQRAGLVPEKPPHPRRLSGWYSAALSTLGGDVGRLKEAFLAFGDDPHWQAATPPLPFAAWISQWDRFVRGGVPARSASRSIVTRPMEVSDASLS